MKESEIIKAFEGRWRIKGNFGQINSNSASMSFDEFYGYIKGMCLDFFRTGIFLGEGFQVEETFDEEGKPTGQTVIYKHDPVLDTADCGFSEWWEMYGKKIDRGKCEKKWAKLSFAEKQACIAATPAYVASTPDLQFRRHPITYLNNKSWENQIIPHNNGTNKPTIDEQRRDKLASILTD